jgi:hypothetical protein
LGVGHYRVLFDWESTIKAVSLMVDRVTPIRAWREYLDLTQEEVAEAISCKCGKAIANVAHGAESLLRRFFF